MQQVNTEFGRLFEAWKDKPDVFATSTGYESVSYTHLDVYKRQVWKIFEKPSLYAFKFAHYTYYMLYPTN